MFPVSGATLPAVTVPAGCRAASLQSLPLYLSAVYTVAITVPSTQTETLIEQYVHRRYFYATNGNTV